MSWESKTGAGAYSSVIGPGDDGISTRVVFNTVDVCFVSFERLHTLTAAKVPDQCLPITALYAGAGRERDVRSGFAVCCTVQLIRMYCSFRRVTGLWT